MIELKPISGGASKLGDAPRYISSVPLVVCCKTGLTP